jgi:hypothetical protein
VGSGGDADLREAGADGRADHPALDAGVDSRD